MIAGLPLSFAEPMLLLGLLSLPVLWWLLRVIPPRPRRIEFPPTQLLFDIAPKEETPSRTPWWLTALRLPRAPLAILAGGGALWDPPAGGFASRRPGHSRRRRADRESAGRCFRLARTARDPDRRWLERGRDLGRPGEGRG